MKLDPVFVLTPKAEPPKIPTRRAFLMAGTTFVLGSSLGGACGYALGSAQSSAKEPAAEPAPKVEEELKPSGDSDLDELRRLAVKAPIEELVQFRLIFVNTTFKKYPDDAVLWRGIGRLCDAVVGDFPIPDRKFFVQYLVQVIEQGQPSLTKDLMPRIDELRRHK